MVVDCRYDNLIDDLARAGLQEEIPEGPGPLLNIAQALEGTFKFRYDRHLQKAINVPYPRLLSNYDVFVRRLRDSEFSAFASTLE
jgi:hypothetical protein